jgi:hypothetical protein
VRVRAVFVIYIFPFNVGLEHLWNLEVGVLFGARLRNVRRRKWLGGKIMWYDVRECYLYSISRVYKSYLYFISIFTLSVIFYLFLLQQYSLFHSLLYLNIFFYSFISFKYYIFYLPPTIPVYPTAPSHPSPPPPPPP